MAGIYEGIGIHQGKRRRRTVHKVSEINEQKEDQCIKLLTAYGNVDAALRWQKAFIKLCTVEEIGCIQSQTDPCMLCKCNETGELQLIIEVCVDDILISGKEEEIHKFKTKFKQTYKITDLGKLKWHLGIWYEWIKTKEGSIIKMHMDNVARKIVKEYEELTHGAVKEWTSPGTQALN